MKNDLNVIDLFCGAGGLTLGFEYVGFKSVLAIDVWEDAIKTFNHNRKNKVGIVKNISEIDEDFINNNISCKINGIVGGPPCQGFSLAGRRSVDDVRNQLYKDYYKTLELVKPDFFVIENVVGILTLDKGNFKEDILRKANNLGYNMYFKKLLSSDYGVPQNRARVFFVGIRKELDCSGFEFPKKHETIITCEDALSDLPLLENNKTNTNYSCKPKNDYQKEIRGNSSVVLNHENSNHTEETKYLISLVPEGGSLKDLPEHLRGNRKYMSLLRRMDRNNPSNTIDTGHRTYFHYSENRVISVREAARLQSFPDEYEFLGGKQSQYKQVGNAVPPLLAKEVASSIKEYLYK